MKRMQRPYWLERITSHWIETDTENPVRIYLSHPPSPVEPGLSIKCVADGLLVNGNILLGPGNYDYDGYNFTRREDARTKEQDA